MSEETPQINWLARDVGVIRNFMRPDECESYILLSEKHGYEEAPVTTANGMVMMKDVRNNDRVMIDDFERANNLYGRARPFLPEKFRSKWSPIGLNERLRLYRYDVGQQFDWHQDGYFEREDGERSHFTFMVYLNDGFEGGSTSFRDTGFGTSRYDGLVVHPQKGMALLFHHPIPHRGAPVLAGRKYVLRSDIIFQHRKNTPQSTSSPNQAK